MLAGYNGQARTVGRLTNGHLEEPSSEARVVMRRLRWPVGAGALAPEALRTRMDLVQGRATSATSVPDSAFSSKIKSWLLATKQTEEVN